MTRAWIEFWNRSHYPIKIHSIMQVVLIQNNNFKKDCLFSSNQNTIYVIWSNQGRLCSRLRVNFISQIWETDNRDEFRMCFFNFLCERNQTDKKLNTKKFEKNYEWIYRMPKLQKRPSNCPSSSRGEFIGLFILWICLLKSIRITIPKSVFFRFTFSK